MSGMRAMDWPAIRARIEAGEGHETEFKRGLGDLSAIGRAVCAFANSDGGVVIIGVSDSGEIAGASADADRVQERLTSFLQTGCSSPVSARLGRREVAGGGWAHWIEVPRQRGFEPMRYSGRVWIRRGRASVEPSASEKCKAVSIKGERGSAGCCLYLISYGELELDCNCLDSRFCGNDGAISGMAAQR